MRILWEVLNISLLFPRERCNISQDKSVLKYGLLFQDLYDPKALHRLDTYFLAALQEADPPLAERLHQGRQGPEALSKQEESSLILEFAPFVEDFISHLFGIEKEIALLQEKHQMLAPLYRCKRLFIQRQALKAYTLEETTLWTGENLLKALEYFLQGPFSELFFATTVLQWLTDEKAFSQELEAARRYSAWRCYHQRTGSVLFSLPQKRDPAAFLSLKTRCHQGFDLWAKPLAAPPTLSREKALDQSHYCILCHHQGKDSCSTGLKEKKDPTRFQQNTHGIDLLGCPLEQKISEMNTLRRQGYALGALATIMIDNPLVAATGHRICNACMQSCIYQKQDPVDVPAVETQTLQDILALPWGFEIYSLLSRWNPLNFRAPLPLPPSGYKVLIAGLGPAGFTLAHYLLNQGHSVVGIDGLAFEALPSPVSPLQDVQELFLPLVRQTPQRFGGVMAYGITSRWDKNYLTLVRLLLEQRETCLFLGSVRLGSTLTVEQAFEKGFDHVALCLGAGRSTFPLLKNGLARGVRTASDFLMTLHLTGAGQEGALANLQIRLPIAVIGGGLTGVDTAAEALNYYPIHVERFLRQYEAVGPSMEALWDGEEKEIAAEFLAHARALRAEKAAAAQENRPPRLVEFLQEWGGATVFYRRTLQESPSYRVNDEEVAFAFEKGIFWKDTLTPEEVITDTYGHAQALRFQETQTLFPCRSIFIATGTAPVSLDTYKGEKILTRFGDLDPAFQGSVVKAMASAKKGAVLVDHLLHQAPPSPVDFGTLAHALTTTCRSVVQRVIPLTPTIWEIVVKSPQAAQQFRPGQFFRLQHGEGEPLALTGAEVFPEAGLISLIVLDVGVSSHLSQFLKPGETVSLMGPTGTPTTIPTQETVLLVGGGLGNAVLFSIAHALKEKGNRVLSVAGYQTPADIFKRGKLETTCDQLLWACEKGIVRPNPTRPQDLFFPGHVVDALRLYAQQDHPLIPLQQVDRLLVIGSDTMIAAVAQARHTDLKDKLNPAHVGLGSINSPMHCMMKEICGQCLQVHHHPETGETQLVFSCHTQDQLLDHVDFPCLHQRLRQNSVLEKLSRAYVMSREARFRTAQEHPTPDAPKELLGHR